MEGFPERIVQWFQFIERKGKTSYVKNKEPKQTHPVRHDQTNG